MLVDLKPGNILFQKGEIKIADFGLSKLLDCTQDEVELTSPGIFSDCCYGASSSFLIMLAQDMDHIGTYHQKYSIVTLLFRQKSTFGQLE